MPHIESRWLLGPVVACAGLAVLFAIPLYLVTPRSSAERLQFGNPRVEIGFASNHMVDLRRTVELQDNPDPVFEVQTEYCDGRIKEDLDLSQYWRGAILTRYHQGIWIPERHRLPTAVETPRGDPGESWQPPDFGPNTYRIRYTLLTEERASFLAVPVIWASSQPVPVATICGSGLRGWTTALDGSGNFHRAHCGNPRAIPRQYVQYSRSGTESDLGPAFQLLKSARPEERLRDLITNYPLRVREYTDRLLIRLVEQGRLPPHAVPTGDPDLGIRRVPDECQEAVARAFADYLANDPSFHYTTQLQRITPDIDPIVEFLFELKRGHCERFATALVMMLRSQGIPAVFVLGFRGCEQIAPGRGVVRQRDAHAWVEVLISRPARGMTHGDPAADWHWLSLDPTPSHSSNNHAVGQSKSIWTRSLEWVSNTVQHYVHNYTSSRRELTLQAMRDLIASPSFLLGSGAFVVVVWGVRYMVRRRAIVSRNDVPDAFAWFERLLSVVGSSGLIRTVDQTPFEFAHMVANALRHRSELAPLAHIPIEWALAYYHMRYGLHPLTTDQRARLSASLDRLANALRNQPFLNRSCP